MESISQNREYSYFYTLEINNHTSGDSLTQAFKISDKEDLEGMLTAIQKRMEHDLTPLFTQKFES
jgi:hypothetical protein